MKIVGMIGAIAWLVFFTEIPAVGHGGCHHDHDYGECWDCGLHRRQGPQASQGRWEPPGGPAALVTLEGKIAEVVYLPGATADTGMVEVRVQGADQTKLIRLAPTGFLKQSGLLLREGDTVMIKGFPVTGMEEELIVAVEVQKGDKVFALRDTRGLPAW